MVVGTVAGIAALHGCLKNAEERPLHCINPHHGQGLALMRYEKFGPVLLKQQGISNST
jgi:hypothetical protein